ncbi:CaiB/BaiF CoA transferase family protein [Alteribacillus sp. HJP-4]|uniref:CaiB/BaiF CoA transferase family protein n=1 Tax=Alteribacillus sp. HJP-4 TaxID=2775394 RepID=UPI0035CCE3A9
MIKPLENVKILDLSRVLAGPLGSMILADLGADVIRVEAPEGKDDIRHWWPFIEDSSTYYLSANRNKKSMTINLKKQAGRELFLDFVKDADVVIENFKTGTMDRLGIGYEELKKVNDQIILCSVTGYGQTGPLKGNPGYDPVIQAVGGLMDVTGEPDGNPTRVGTPVVDIMASHYVGISVLSSLMLRDKQQVGQHIDLSLLDVQVGSLANIASSYLIKNHVSTRVGNAHGNITPYETFMCMDKLIMVAAGNDRMFQSLCQAMERPEWAELEEYKTNGLRIQHRQELRALLEERFKDKTAYEWESVLVDHNVPCGAVNNVEQVFEHPQVKAREMVQEYDHPTLGRLKTVRSPLRFSSFEPDVKDAPPELGQHTEDILSEERGLSKQEIEMLKKNGII